jgi:hypothetical protein
MGPETKTDCAGEGNQVRLNQKINLGTNKNFRNQELCWRGPAAIYYHTMLLRIKEAGYTDRYTGTQTARRFHKPPFLFSNKVRRITNMAQRTDILTTEAEEASKLTCLSCATHTSAESLDSCIHYVQFIQTLYKTLGCLSLIGFSEMMFPCLPTNGTPSSI